MRKSPSVKSIHVQGRSGIEAGDTPSRQIQAALQVMLEFGFHLKIVGNHSRKWKVGSCILDHLAEWRLAGCVGRRDTVTGGARHQLGEAVQCFRQDMIRVCPQAKVTGMKQRGGC